MPLSLDGYRAYICCDGEELEQFDVKEEDDRTINCWIASVAEREFTVNWSRVPSKDEALQVKLYMDGRLTGYFGYDREKMTDTIRGIRTGQNLLRLFKFAPLVLTDDEGAITAPSGSNIEKLGSIELVMTRARRFIRTETVANVLKLDEIGPVHEKSKKGGVHAVALGQAEHCKPSYSVTLVGPEQQPFATFRFRYRPLELLQANGIAPLPPKPTQVKKRTSDAHETPSPGPSQGNKRPRVDKSPSPPAQPKVEVDSDDDDADDVTFLEEQLAMLQKRLAEKKAKKKAVVKREVSPISVPAAWSNEAIDLT